MKRPAIEDPMLMAVNRITDHMIENCIPAVRLAGVTVISDLYGTTFFALVYEILNPLTLKEQQEALRILKGLNI